MAFRALVCLVPIFGQAVALPQVARTLDTADAQAFLLLPTPAIVQRDFQERGFDMPLTVHSEITQSDLDVPTPTSTPSTSDAVSTPLITTPAETHHHPGPETVHVETTDTGLLVPTTPAAQTTTDQPSFTFQPVSQPTAMPDSNSAATTSDDVTVFIAPAPATQPVPPPQQGTSTVHVETTAPGVLLVPASTPEQDSTPAAQTSAPYGGFFVATVPTANVPEGSLAQTESADSFYIAPAATGSTISLVPTSIISIYTSQGIPYYTTIATSIAAQISTPAILSSSQAGAIGIAAGSATTIGGTTYSVASNGNAIYINGMSSSLPGYVHSAKPTVYTTSNGIVLANGTPVMVAATGTTNLIKSMASSSSTAISKTSTSLLSSTSIAPAVTPTLPGSAMSLDLPYWSTGIAAAIAYIALV